MLGRPSRTKPLRFRRSVVRDLRNRLRFALLGLFILIGLHIVAMMTLEGLGAGDAAWLTFTTITTTGYGDLSAKTNAGRGATIVLIYLSGIFMLTQATGAFFELRALRRSRMRRGEWRWSLQNHIVFVNTPTDEPADYLRRLLDQMHRSHAALKGIKSVVLTEAFPDGLPPTLEDDPLVVQVKGRFDDIAALDATSVRQAKIVVILAEREGDRLSDSRTFDIIHRLREMPCTARIVAECVDDINRERFRKAGADAVVRPLRGYPEMIVRAIVAPGAERIIESLFSSEGDECLRFNVTCHGQSWARIVEAVMKAGLGTALGYVDSDGLLHSNPSPGEIRDVTALFIVVNDRQTTTSSALQAVLSSMQRLPASEVAGSNLSGQLSKRSGSTNNIY